MSETTLYLALGVSAWLVATAAPPAVAIVCWGLARRLRQGWIVHVFFVPFLLLVEWLSTDVLFFAAHDNGDGPPGLGLAILPAFALLALSVAGYYCALLAKCTAGSRGGA